MGTRLLAVCLVLVLLATAAASAGAVPAERAVAVLVRDVLAVERGDTPLLRAYDGARLGLMAQRIVKDRYDALFSWMCVQQGGTHENLFPPPPDVPQLTVDADPALLERLRERHARTFISTEMGVRGCQPTAAFMENGARLRALLADAQTELQRHPGPSDAEAALPSPAAVTEYLRLEPDVDLDAGSPERLAALRCLLNTTCLPSHADVALAFPWLDAAAAAPDALDEAVLLRPLRVPPARLAFDLLTPAAWLYYFSNGYLKVCELLTREYVAGLARYVAHRLERYAAPGAALTVLEIGAGNGRLTHFLAQAVTAAPALAGVQLTFVASDIAGNVGDATLRFPVIKRDHVAALKHHRPVLVLVSWMSKDDDWTAAVRATSSVREYVLIGEKDYGVSGRAKETWGTPKGTTMPPWRSDGFERCDLDELSLLQIGRSDSPLVRFHSHTVAFVRQTAPARRDEL